MGLGQLEQARLIVLDAAQGIDGNLGAARRLS